MPTYKLIYFNGRGRAEIIRMVFAAAEKKYEDKRVTGEEYAKIKSDLPQGTLPVLEIDGKIKIAQSLAIARFLAREFNLYPKENSQIVIVDQIMDTVLDLAAPFLKAAFNKDEAEKKTLMAKFTTEDGPKYLGFLEDLVKQSGKGGFAVGATLTLADFAIYTYLEMTNTHESLDKFPKLAENRKKVADLPRIKAYLAKRPETDF